MKIKNIIINLKGNMYRTICSILWICLHYKKFKVKINKTLRITKLKPILINHWHFGQRYFTASVYKNDTKVFIKSLGNFESNLNEIAALKILGSKNEDKGYFPNIIENFEYYFEPVVVMELIKGDRLDKLINEKYQFSEVEIRNILNQFCNIVDILYKNDIVHRDVRPENIIIQNGKVKLFDFSYSVTQKSDILKDINNIENKELFLKNLGGNYRFDNLKWDDSYSFLKIAESIYKLDELNNISEYINLKDKVGRFAYQIGEL